MRKYDKLQQVNNTVSWQESRNCLLSPGRVARVSLLEVIRFPGKYGNEVA